MTRIAKLVAKFLSKPPEIRFDEVRSLLEAFGYFKVSEVSVQRSPLEHYLSLKYPVTLYEDDEGGYVAEIKDLPGCLTQGETLQETMDNIEEARQLWIETVYASGKQGIPLPSV